jgi:hypothetical protein
MSDDPELRSIDDYLKQWKRNRRFCSTIDSEYKDWQVTATFYTALQAINAAAAFLGEKPANHTARNDLVKNNEVFVSVRKKYLLLYRLSRFTRYDPKPDEWLPPEYLTPQALVDEVLKPIEANIQTLIGKDLKLPAMTMKK